MMAGEELVLEPVEMGPEDWLGVFAQLRKEAGSPSIGRTVHYTSLGTNGDRGATRAAIITTDGAMQSTMAGPIPAYQLVLGLCILHPKGAIFEDHVPFSHNPKPGHWSWPPRIGTS